MRLDIRGRRCLIPISLMAACLVGCAPSARRDATTDTPAHELSTQVDELLRSVERFDSSEDLDGILSCYDREVVWLPGDAAAIHGLDEISKRYRPLFSENDLTVKIHEESIRFDGPLATIRGTTDVTRTLRSSGETEHSSDRFVMIARRRDGKWLIAVLAWWPVDDAR